MWQQGGSSEGMKFEDAKNWIEELNQNGFAGCNDWRLPTLEEAMSVMEPEKKELYIDPIFDSEQWYIWTADKLKGESRQWIVRFNLGLCNQFYPSHFNGFVRAVRSRQSDKSD